MWFRCVFTYSIKAAKKGLKKGCNFISIIDGWSGFRNREYAINKSIRLFSFFLSLGMCARDFQSSKLSFIRKINGHTRSIAFTKELELLELHNIHSDYLLMRCFWDIIWKELYYLPFGCCWAATRTLGIKFEF